MINAISPLRLNTLDMNTSVICLSIISRLLVLVSNLLVACNSLEVNGPAKGKINPYLIAMCMQFSLGQCVHMMNPETIKRM